MAGLLHEINKMISVFSTGAYNCVGRTPLHIKIEPGRNQQFLAYLLAPLLLFNMYFTVKLRAAEKRILGHAVIMDNMVPKYNEKGKARKQDVTRHGPANFTDRSMRRMGGGG